MNAPEATPAQADPPPKDRLPNLNPQVEAELVGEVRQLFVRARDKRRPLMGQWKRNWKVLRPRQLDPAMRSWKPNPEVPEILPIIDTLVAWMTDQDPSFAVSPVVPPLNPWYQDMSKLAQDLETTMQSSWHVDRTTSEVEKVCWDGFTYGIGWFKTVWDQSAYNGMGNSVCRRRDPFCIYPDPDAKSPATMDYIIDAETISKQELERRFPGALARLDGDGFNESVESQPTQTDPAAGGQMPKANPGAMTNDVRSPRYGLPGQSRVSVNDDSGVTVLEAWMRVPKEDDDGEVYDAWRCVVVAGNRVLLDEFASDLWAHGQHPFDRYVPIETGEFYGDALVSLLAPAQESINRILGSMEHNLWLTGNPVLRERDMGMQRTAVTNKPGTRIPVPRGGDVGWMEPPTPAPGLAAELIRHYTDRMERISGLTAVVRGATPTGRNAEGVIDATQESAFMRIRKAMRNLALTLGSAGEKMASNIVEFYDTPRIISLVGEGGQKVVTDLGANHFYVPGPDGTAPMRFQLLIDAGASVSQSHDTRKAEATALFAIGAIDNEALLRVHNFPDWPMVVQRQRELQAQQGTLGLPPTQRAAARR